MSKAKEGFKVAPFLDPNSLEIDNTDVVALVAAVTVVDVVDIFRLSLSNSLHLVLSLRTTCDV